MPAITGARAGHPRRGLSIGELARASGVGVETIRFWERSGLLPAPPRSPTGRRLYGPEAVERLRFVRHARALGFPLEEVRTLLAMASGEAGGCAEVRALAERHLRAVRARIARLERMEAALETTLARCAQGELSCPLLAALAEPESPLDELPAEPGVAGGPV
jgi:MerR family mercuric resistance operon transcriptional regulator